MFTRSCRQLAPRRTLTVSVFSCRHVHKSQLSALPFDRCASLAVGSIRQVCFSLWTLGFPAAGHFRDAAVNIHQDTDRGFRASRAGPREVDSVELRNTSDRIGGDIAGASAAKTVHCQRPTGGKQI
ncbi:hypothetical protein ABQE45_24020 [Mycobacteroides chelonae]